MSWRHYEAKDRAAVEELKARMEHRINRTLDVPDLAQRPVICSLVYEKHGEISHAVFVEVECEVQALGEAPLPKQEWDTAGELLIHAIKTYDIRVVRAFVPRLAMRHKRHNKPSPVERILRYFKFSREDQSQFAPFVRWLGGN